MEILVAKQEDYEQIKLTLGDVSASSLRCSCNCSCANCGRCGCTCTCYNGRCSADCLGKCKCRGIELKETDNAMLTAFFQN